MHNSSNDQYNSSQMEKRTSGVSFPTHMSLSGTVYAIILDVADMPSVV